MTAQNVRRAFIILHLTLGLTLLGSALLTLIHALREHGGPDFHLGLVIGLESLGAVLFLIPRTLRIGGGLLLVVLLVGFVIHLTRSEWELQLLAWAAGVWFVMVHGAEWGNPGEAS